MPSPRSKKGRKFGRNKKKCERYKLEGRRERNKKVRIARHARFVARRAAVRAEKEHEQQENAARAAEVKRQRKRERELARAPRVRLSD